MNKVLLVFITGALLGCSKAGDSCKDAVIDEDIKSLDDYHRVFYEEDYTGTVVDYHDERKILKFIIHYENGAIVKYESFYEDGDRKFVKPIKCNASHGNVIYYMDNNMIGYEMEYVLGKKHGTGRSYYENGYVEKLVSYVEGKKDGWQYEFSHSGDTLKTAYYRKGEKIR